MSQSERRTCAILVFLSGLSFSALAQDPVDLGTLPGYTLSRPKHVSEQGDVVGQAARAAGSPLEQAVFWRKRARGRLAAEALPALDGLESGDARAIARQRTPVGFSYLIANGYSLFRAVAWDQDEYGHRLARDLEPPPGFTDAQAYGANARGLIVGEAANPGETVNGSVVRHAVLWERHGDSYGVCDLGVPDGFDASTAFDVSSAGDAVGTARRLESDGAGGLRTRSDVVVWQRRGWGHGCAFEAILLESRDDLPFNQNPAISDRGDVVARADRLIPGQATVSRPLLWTRSCRGYQAPLELPLPEGFGDGFARSLNDRGEIVGTVQVRGASGAIVASRAVVWRPAPRRRFAVTLLPNPADTALSLAEGINERGEIVGSSPLPQPGTSGGLLWEKRRPGCRNNSAAGAPAVLSRSPALP